MNLKVSLRIHISEHYFQDPSETVRWSRYPHGRRSAQNEDTVGFRRFLGVKYEAVKVPCDIFWKESPAELRIVAIHGFVVNLAGDDGLGRIAHPRKTQNKLQSSENEQWDNN